MTKIVDAAYNRQPDNTDWEDMNWLERRCTQGVLFMVFLVYASELAVYMEWVK